MNELLSGRRLLVVEDEMLVLMNVEDALADLGCTSIQAAATVAQALALIESHAFDAAMLDMNLAGESTYEIADALAAKDVPYLFATGYDGRDVLPGYRERPMLHKPFLLGDLVDALTLLLRAEPLTEPA